MIDANSPTYLDALRPYPLKGSIVALVGGAE